MSGREIEAGAGIAGSVIASSTLPEADFERQLHALFQSGKIRVLGGANKEQRHECGLESIAILSEARQRGLIDPSTGYPRNYDAQRVIEVALPTPGKVESGAPSLAGTSLSDFRAQQRAKQSVREDGPEIVETVSAEYSTENGIVTAKFIEKLNRSGEVVGNDLVISFGPDGGVEVARFFGVTDNRGFIAPEEYPNSFKWAVDLMIKRGEQDKFPVTLSRFEKAAERDDKRGEILVRSDENGVRAVRGRYYTKMIVGKGDEAQEPQNKMLVCDVLVEVTKSGKGTGEFMNLPSVSRSNIDRLVPLKIAGSDARKEVREALGDRRKYFLAEGASLPAGTDIIKREVVNSGSPGKEFSVVISRSPSASSGVDLNVHFGRTVRWNCTEQELFVTRPIASGIAESTALRIGETWNVSTALERTGTAKPETPIRQQQTSIARNLSRFASPSPKSQRTEDGSAEDAAMQAAARRQGEDRRAASATLKREKPLAEEIRTVKSKMGNVIITAQEQGRDRYSVRFQVFFNGEHRGGQYFWNKASKSEVELIRSGELKIQPAAIVVDEATRLTLGEWVEQEAEKRSVAEEIAKGAIKEYFRSLRPTTAV